MSWRTEPSLATSDRTVGQWIADCCTTSQVTREY